MANDTAPKREDFMALEPPVGLEFVVSSDHSALFVLLFSESRDEAEIHFSFAPKAWGNTETIAAAFLCWIWAIEPQLWKLTGPVPQYNSLAKSLASRVGFVERGRIPGPTKHGRNYDLIIMELQRPAYAQQSVA